MKGKGGILLISFKLEYLQNALKFNPFKIQYETNCKKADYYGASYYWFGHIFRF